MATLGRWTLPVISLMTTLMYFISGTGKIRSLGQNGTSMLIERLAFLSSTWGRIVIVLVGLLEVVAPALMLYASWPVARDVSVVTTNDLASKRKRRRLGMWSAIFLAGFTALATALFYTVPFERMKFMSHLTMTGGLLAMAWIFSAE